MEHFSRKVLKISAIALILLLWVMAYILSAPSAAEEDDSIHEKLDMIETKVDVIQIQIDDIILKLLK